MIWESDLERYKLDSIRFGDYLKNYNPDLLSEQYKRYMIMDILNLSEKEIDEMEYVKYNEAVNYATSTYKLRSMGVSEKKGSRGDHHTFEQPDDYDIDPKFISNVGK